MHRFFRHKEGVSRWSTAKDGIHVGVVDAFLGVGRPLGILPQRTLVDLVLVKVPQEGFDSCGNPSALLRNPSTSVANPDVSAILVPRNVWEIIVFANSFGVGVKDAHDNILGGLVGVHVPADNVQKKFPARFAVLYQGIQFRISGDAMPPEIAPLVAFEGILAAQIGSCRILSVEPKGRKLDVLTNQRLPESPRLEGVSIRWILGQFFPEEGSGRNRLFKGNASTRDSWYSLA